MRWLRGPPSVEFGKRHKWPLDGEDYEAARRLRQRYEEDMRLLDDLGWEPNQNRDEFEVTMDHDDLARDLMRRLNGSAGDTPHIYVVEPSEGEFVTRAASTQAAVGDAFAQMAGVRFRRAGRADRLRRACSR